jgi:hypothetical protein
MRLVRNKKNVIENNQSPTTNPEEVNDSVDKD